MSSGADTADRAALVPLTEREREVAALLGEGLTNAEIAERLGITFATAKWHVSQVLSKFGAETRDGVAERLAAFEREPARPRRNWAPWAAIPWLKGLGLAAAAVPVMGVVAAGAVVLSARGGSPDAGPESEYPLVASVASATPTPRTPPPGIITPSPQPHTCDWQAGQLNKSGGALDHSGCDFSGVEFAPIAGVMWNNAILAGANFAGARFLGGSLYSTDMTNTNLRGTWFIEAVMGFVNFDGADLTGAHFTMSIVDGTFRGATCPDGQPANAKPRGTCIGSAGMEHLPVTRSFEQARGQIGWPAGKFTLPDAKDPAQTVVIPESGRTTLLWWFADWSGRSVNEVAEIKRIATERPDVAVIGLSLDGTPAEALAFAQKHGLAFPIAMDSTREAADRYEIIAGGIAAVVDARGNVHSHGAWSSWSGDRTFTDFLNAIP